VSGDDRRSHWPSERSSDPDAVARFSRALEMARRRLRYRIATAVIVAATVVAVLVLIR
jgi:hypothetical protein